MILQDLTMPALAIAMEANFNEEALCFGRSRLQWELHKTPELYWMYTGPGEQNGVFLSSFDSDDAAYTGEKINEMLDFYSSRHTSFIWTTGPSTYPGDLATLLEARGFALVANTIGMAADVRALDEQVHTNASLLIKEVEDLHALNILCEVEMRGFDTSEEGAQRYYDTYANAGFGPGTPWHHYIGWLRDVPVASASLLYHAGVAGIYGISTLPEARRQGVAAAMTLHQARDTGYRVAILSPTDMSETIYRRIGFRAYCTLQHYRWPLGEE
jgi:ribosomal protein S18 acetylase RimI-like enzyme